MYSAHSYCEYAASLRHESNKRESDATRWESVVHVPIGVCAIHSVREAVSTEVIYAILSYWASVEVPLRDRIADSMDGMSSE